MFTAASLEKRRAWEERIRLQKESGLSVERWCRDHQVSYHGFIYWKKRLNPSPPLSRSSFTELSDAKGTGIVIEHRGIRIHLDKHFEPATLKRCLAVLKEIKC